VFGREAILIIKNTLPIGSTLTNLNNKRKNKNHHHPNHAAGTKILLEARQKSRRHNLEWEGPYYELAQIKMITAQFVSNVLKFRHVSAPTQDLPNLMRRGNSELFACGS
jgi:hypothetical protein